MFALNWILAIVTLITVPIMFYVTKKLVAYSKVNADEIICTTLCVKA
jgi:hypothetical protein